MFWDIFYWRLLQKIQLIHPPPPPEQNGPHFADDIFKCIVVNEKLRFNWQ